MRNVSQQNRKQTFVCVVNVQVHAYILYICVCVYTMVADNSLSAGDASPL